MTFDDDFCQINFTGGVKRIPCVALEVEWPPPKILDFYGFQFKLIRYSGITDEQRAGMDAVIRGAEYQPVGVNND